MKKSKVSRLIEKFKREAHAAGRAQGKREEQARYEEMLIPPRDGFIWLGHKPPTRDYYSVAMSAGFYPAPLQFDPDSMYRPNMGNQRVDFKLKQKGVAFSNGVSVRWADWEPMGPYPVISFSDPPRRW